MSESNQEVYYQVISTVHITLKFLIVAGGFACLLKPFLRKKGLAGVAGIVYFTVIEILYYIPVYFSNFAAYFLGILAVFVTVGLVDRRNLNQKAFLCVTFFSLRWLSYDMSNCINKIFYYESMKLPGFVRNWELQLKLFILEQVLDTLIVCIFIAVPVWLVSKIYIYKEEAVTRGEALMLSMPCLSAMLAYNMQQYFDEIYQRDAGKCLFDIYGIYNWISFFYYVFFVVTILVVIILFQNLKGRQMDEQQTMLMKGQVRDMERHISEVEKLYKDIRSLKHEMGNHIMTLEGLYMREKREEAREYTTQLKEQLRSTDFLIKSGNPVTDVILTEKYKEAKEKGISFSCNFCFPEGTQINAFDVSIILNNAVINAIEAAEMCGTPYIRIFSRRQKNAYLITIENSCLFAPEIDVRNGLPVTTKKDRSCHGFGLANIKRVAQSYYGDIDIAYTEGNFELNIMLMCI